MKKNEDFEEFDLEEESCKCHDHNCGCADGKECTCGDDCQCGDSCTCHEDDSCHGHSHEHKCHCHDDEQHECHCHNHECEDDDCHCGHNHDLASEYLALAQHLQADFDNYRKRVAEQLDYQRDEGKKSVISVFLPCLDTFKEAKKSITDENVLAGVNMIEEKIVKALATLNVEKIDAIGEKFDHNLHEVIAVMKDENKENDVILEEYQTGWTFKGKVIRYSKVIVNKLD